MAEPHGLSAGYIPGNVDPRVHFTLEVGMADDLEKTGEQDDERINVDQDHELSYWSDKLGVSRDKLRETVARVGPLRQAVERALRG